MLRDKTRAFSGIAARRRCGRFDQHLDLATACHAKHPEAEPAAEVAVTRVTFASLAARRHFGGEPDLVTGGRAIDRLQNQLEIEGELQFSDHHDRRIVDAQPDEVAAADLALDREAELFEKAFDGQVKRSFQGKIPAAREAATHVLILAEFWQSV